MLVIKDLYSDISDCFWLFYGSKYTENIYKSKFYKQFQTYDKKLKLLHQTEGFPGGNPSAVFSIYGHLCAEAFSLLPRYLHPAPAIAGFHYLYLCRYPFRHFRHV